MAAGDLAPTLKCRLPLWEAKLPKPVLVARYHAIGAPAFDRGYRQRPQSSSDLVFGYFEEGKVYFWDEDWAKISSERLRQFDEDGRALEHPNRHVPGYVDPSWPRFTGVDLSSKTRRGTVIFTLALAPDGVHHPLDVRVGAWTAPEKAAEIEQVAQTFRPASIFIENNALQGMLVEWLEVGNLTCSKLVHGFNTGGTKMHPELGLPGINVQMSKGLWRVGIPHPEGEVRLRVPNYHECACGWCLYVRDTRTLTIEDVAAKKTPDTVMAMWLAKEAARQGRPWVASESRTHAFDRVRAPLVRSHDYRIRAGTSHNPFRRRPRTDNYGRPLPN
jgi:hypothetical protein